MSITKNSEFSYFFMKSVARRCFLLKGALRLVGPFAAVPSNRNLGRPSPGFAADTARDAAQLSPNGIPLPAWKMACKPFEVETIFTSEFRSLNSGHPFNKRAIFQKL